MTKEEDFKLLKIQTCILKVNIDCDGCKHKVKKLLQRIDGVYQVSIDADQQKVTVSGNVDSVTLINKLVRAGKCAEVWPQKGNQIKNQKKNYIKDEKNNKAQKQGIIQGLEGIKNQQKFPFLIPEEDEDCSDDEYEDNDEEDQLRVMMERANQLGLLRQATVNVKKAAAAAVGGPNNSNVKGNAPKKGVSDHKKGSKGNPSGDDQKTTAALKSSSLGRRNINDIMGLSAHPRNDGFQGYPGSNGGYINDQYPSSMLLNMNEYNHPSPLTNFNMQNGHALQQPQMMYQMSPYVTSGTGYQYNSYGNPYLYSYNYGGANESSAGDTSAADMFSDDNTSSCSIM